MVPLEISVGSEVELPAGMKNAGRSTADEVRSLQMQHVSRAGTGSSRA